MAGVRHTTLCDKVCLFALWFSPCTPVSSTNKTGRHDIAKIMLKVARNTPTNNTNLISARRSYDAMTGQQELGASQKYILYYKVYFFPDTPSPCGLAYVSPASQVAPRSAQCISKSC